MLRVELESFDGDRIILDYENFAVENENDNYRMRVGRYLGNNTRYRLPSVSYYGGA